jgi:hypothetical protein
MMCPDNSAIDHVGGGIAFHHLGERFEHRIEHRRRDPSPVSAEDAVPLAIFIGQMTPLRPGPGHPHHAFEIAPIVLRRTASSTPLCWQKWPYQCPFLIRNPNPLAQCCLQKTALNQWPSPASSFVHEA